MIFVVPTVTGSVHPSNSDSAGCAIKLWHCHPLSHSRNKNQGPETAKWEHQSEAHGSCWAAPPCSEWLRPQADTRAAASSPPPPLLSMTKWQYRSKAGLSQPEKTEGLCSPQQCVNRNHIPAKLHAVVKTSGSKPSFKKETKSKQTTKITQSRPQLPCFWVFLTLPGAQKDSLMTSENISSFLLTSN